MKVNKKIGYGYITFEGTAKAIDMLTRIHKRYSNRGYGIVFPAVDSELIITARGVGTVKVIRHSEAHCEVLYVEGALKSLLRN